MQSKFFQLIYHVGCAFYLHSIINCGLISGGESSSKRQTVFFFLVDPMDKSHKDPKVIDLNVPRYAQYPAQCIEETSTRSISGGHQPCHEERIDILSDSIECYHLSRNASSLF